MTFAIPSRNWRITGALFSGRLSRLFAEGPVDVLSHEGTRFGATGLKGSDDFSIEGGVAQGNGHIAQPALKARAAQGAAGGARFPGGFIPAKEGQQLAVLKVMAWSEVWRRGGLGELRERTHQLAVVAAKDSIAQGTA
jgi:hypothetical protein